MPYEQDPVDQAIKSLRSQAWPGESHNIELEERLMRESQSNCSVSRLGRHRVLAAALAVLVLGSVGFAAAGGVDMVKNWLLRVEINGQVTEVQLDENGEKTFTINTDDGGTATVDIKKAVSPDEGEMTRVRITKTNDLAGDERRAEWVTKVRVGDEQQIGIDPEKPDLTLADLGGAQPIKKWAGEDGLVSELYILPDEQGQGSRVLIVTTNEDGEAHVRLVATTPRPLLLDGFEPDVQVNDDGLVTITLENGQGQVQVIKARAKRPGPGDAIPDGLKLETPDGEIKVRVQEADRGD
ncbi:MAG: hypothetical protein JXQ75_24260 [Phycisphaerae bacterium]|nr:hypothetical protein [Phycisphaerae bacterium]